MDGENNGTPSFLMDDFGGKTHYFRKHPYINLELPKGAKWFLKGVN